MNKPAGRHKSQQLTVRQIESLSKKGKHQDGGGLILQVYNKDSKQWLLRCTIKGQLNADGKPLRRTFGLGSYKQVSLSQAREKARRYVECARGGNDPSIELRDINEIPDFKTVATEYLDMRLKQPVDIGGWKNEKHRKQWVSTLDIFGTAERCPRIAEIGYLCRGENSGIAIFGPTGNSGRIHPGQRKNSGTVHLYRWGAGVCQSAKTAETS